MSGNTSDKSIVLIGPTGVGKSTVGQALAEALDWRLMELDLLRSSWYPEFGLDSAQEQDAYDHGGLAELVDAWKPYELQSVERVMKEYPERTVIAFGGGQSVYTDEAMISRAWSALSQASRVILLLPSEHIEESLSILVERLRRIPFVTDQADPEGFLRAFSPILTMQLRSKSNRMLATEMIITGRSTPEELALHIATTLETD